MEINELRVGNLLKVDEYHWTVNSILNDNTHPELYFDENIQYDHWLNAEPIPLTEEWLLKLGFTLRDKNYSLNVGGESFKLAFIEEKRPGFYIWKHQDFGWNLNECLEGNYRDNHFIKYVHQLQNLYYSLTGTELLLAKNKTETDNSIETES